MVQATANELLSVAEVAAQLGVHETTVYRLIDAGELPAVETYLNLGRRRALRIRADDLAAFVQSRTEGTVR